MPPPYMLATDLDDLRAAQVATTTSKQAARTTMSAFRKVARNNALVQLAICNLINLLLSRLEPCCINAWKPLI